MNMKFLNTPAKDRKIRNRKARQGPARPDRWFGPTTICSSPSMGSKTRLSPAVSCVLPARTGKVDVLDGSEHRLQSFSEIPEGLTRESEEIGPKH